MWEKNPTEFISSHGISKRLARLCQCTAEHLIARQDGGRNVKQNIVAACAYCNQGRHKKKMAPSPEAMRQDVQWRLSRGLWNSFVFSQADQGILASNATTE
jgi:5-methylcytosine-specific restriction endonuclease McrA